MSWHEGEWAIKLHPGAHGDRVPLMGPIEYEVIGAVGAPFPRPDRARTGCALSLNMSPTGLLLLMDWEPAIDQVLRVCTPTPCPGVSTPTLADVRWARRLPLLRGRMHHLVYFVGVRLLLS